MTTPHPPRLNSPESTLALISEGYTFISDRCDRLDTDVFEARLLLQRTLCMRGRDAAELFYDASRFQREDAAPKRLQKTLVGEGGVQGLDDEAHRHRKAMFMALMTPDARARLMELAVDSWHRSARSWTSAYEVVLLDAVQRLLCRAVCAWAGVPLRSDAELDQRTRELTAMIDGSGGVLVRYLRGRLGRIQGERWAGGLIEQVRDGSLTPPPDSALAHIARHRDLAGELLDTHVAAVELLNVLRPTVAVARFVVFAALAMHDHPAALDELNAGDDDEATTRFVQEVRRFYPFFPFAAARVRHTFSWRGLQFARGRRVLLDLYGTNHDARIWGDPEVFRPGRFAHGEPDAFELVPQGGGDHFGGHRCAGEWITIELLKVAVEFLRHGMHYHVPAQDLRVDLGRAPAQPASGFLIGDVRLATAAPPPSAGWTPGAAHP